MRIDVQQGLEEIEKANMAILVRIEEFHVIDSLKIDVQISKVKLLTGEQNVFQLLLGDLARIRSIFVAALRVE